MIFEVTSDSRYCSFVCAQFSISVISHIIPSAIRRLSLRAIHPNGKSPKRAPAVQALSEKPTFATVIMPYPIAPAIVAATVNVSWIIKYLVSILFGHHLKAITIRIAFPVATTMMMPTRKLATLPSNPAGFGPSSAGSHLYRPNVATTVQSTETMTTMILSVSLVRT